MGGLSGVNKFLVGLKSPDLDLAPKTLRNIIRIYLAWPEFILYPGIGCETSLVDQKRGAVELIPQGQLGRVYGTGSYSLFPLPD